MGFDSCLTITLVPGEQTNLVIEKYMKKGFCGSITLSFTDNELNPLTADDKAKLQGLVGKVYIAVVGHNDRCIGLLENDKHQQVTYQELAELLIENVGPTKVESMEVELFCCLAAGKLHRKEKQRPITLGLAPGQRQQRSFAELFFKMLTDIAGFPVEVVVSPDLYTIKQHPTTREIIDHYETALETQLREQYKVKRREALQGVVSIFVANPIPFYLPTTIASSISFFARENLKVETLMDKKALNVFMSSLCEFLVTVMNDHGDMQYLVPTVLALLYAKDKYLVGESVKRQTIEYDKTTKQIEEANQRRISKVKFVSMENGKEILDCQANSKLKFGSRTATH